MEPEGSHSRAHEAADPQPDDHHPKPRQYTFSETSYSMPPGTTYDVDVTLDHANFTRAHVNMMGPNVGGGGASQWRECAKITAFTSTGRAMGKSAISAGFKKVYAGELSKANGDSMLTAKIFSSNNQVALIDAWITGSTLRLRFQNFYGGSSTLWVKGDATLL